MTISHDDFEKLLIEYVKDKHKLRRARNKCMFLDMWPAIKAMQKKGWSLTTICEVLRENQLLDIRYAALRRYVKEQQGIESKSQNSIPTPKNESQEVKHVQMQKQRSEVKSEIVKPQYSVPPKFTGGRGEGDEDMTTFLLGKGK